MGTRKSGERLLLIIIPKTTGGKEWGSLFGFGGNSIWEENF